MIQLCFLVSESIRRRRRGDIESERRGRAPDDGTDARTSAIEEEIIEQGEERQGKRGITDNVFAIVFKYNKNSDDDGTFY